MICGHLQAVIQGKVLVALSCGEQQVSCSLCVCGFMSADLSIFQNRGLKIISYPNELTPSVSNLWYKSATDKPILTL